jgi:hypothetical protein
VIRTLLDVTPDTVRLAERFGAKRDKLTLEWYVEGEDVPDELLNLVRKSVRTVLLSPEAPVHVVDALVGDGSAPAPQSIDHDLKCLVQLAIEQHSRSVEQASKWFKTPQRALGMRTPTQAAKTPEGRAKVQRLLRDLYA